MINPASWLVFLSFFFLIFVFFAFTYLQTPDPPLPSHKEISMELRAKQRLQAIPVEQCGAGAQMCITTKVQHLIPSELMQDFVHSKGLELCIRVVLIMIRCTQQTGTTTEHLSLVALTQHNTNCRFYTLCAFSIGTIHCIVFFMCLKCCFFSYYL